MSKQETLLEQNLFTMQNPLRKEYARQQKLFQVEILLTGKCAGSCKNCCTFSDMTTEGELSKEVVIKVIDEAWDYGVKCIMWAGGDPILHPDWFELVQYALDKGMYSSLYVSGLISEDVAEKICRLNSYPKYEVTGIHIDTINQEDYNKINYNPKSLEAKIKGYRTLLKAGYPPEKVILSPTMSQPIMDSLPETIDWFADEMGGREMSMCAFKPCGFGDKYRREYEPRLSDVKRVNEYMAKKLGQDWLDIGGTPLGTIYCQGSMNIWYNGDVLPCAEIRDLILGNIYEESIVDIFERNREVALFTQEIKGPCGSCEHNDICRGCRANAYMYTGDMWQSDPKCWLNSEAKELYFR